MPTTKRRKQRVLKPERIWNRLSRGLSTYCLTNNIATRRILESYTARVYLIKRYKSTEDPQLARDVDGFRQSLLKTSAEARMKQPNFDDPYLKHHTQYCASVCPLDELYFDILRWRDEAFPS